MSHYFLHDETLIDHEYNVNYTFNNVQFSLVSNNGVFSKKNLDEGSKILLDYTLKTDIEGSVLDLGCGYGPIGITLFYFNNKIDLTMSDVNPSAIIYTNKNLDKYHIKADVIESDGFNSISKNFDLIVFNPPIRIGKENIFNIYKEVYKHLNNKGRFLIVIRKDKGALSHAKYLLTLFNEVNLVYRDKGYYVYEMIK